MWLNEELVRKDYQQMKEEFECLPLPQELSHCLSVFFYFNNSMRDGYNMVFFIKYYIYGYKYDELVKNYCSDLKRYDLKHLKETIQLKVAQARRKIIRLRNELRIINEKELEY